MNSQVTTTPERQGVGRIVIAGIVLGIIITPLLVYFGIDYFGQVGPACGGGGEQMTCFMRQIVMAGTALPVGAILGFAVSYWIALRRWK